MRFDGPELQMEAPVCIQPVWKNLRRLGVESPSRRFK